MGCAPSKTDSTVHPVDSNNHANGILQVQEVSPDAPSCTPDHTQNSRGDSPAAPSTPDIEATLASELQQKLQSHVASGKERHRFVRQFSNEQTQSNGDYTDGGSSVDLPPDKSNHSWMVEETRKCEVQNKEEYRSPSNTNPQLPNPFIAPARHPLRLQFGTDSQVEFFKMLDKRINEGPDFVPDVNYQKNMHTRH